MVAKFFQRHAKFQPEFSIKSVLKTKVIIMKQLHLASWNVNSINIRLPQVIQVLTDYPIDLLGIQETKTTDDNFPLDALLAHDYHVIFNGQKSYNGTAFVGKIALTDAKAQLPSYLHHYQHSHRQFDYQRRFLQTDIHFLDKRITVVNCYVPNGQSVGSDKYAYKLDWLDDLNHYLKILLQTQPYVVVMGDFNIAPEDIDIFDKNSLNDEILYSEAERARLKTLKDFGFVDSFRHFSQAAGAYSWWDYRSGDFNKNLGFRIDLIWVSKALLPYLQAASILREVRGFERPSDHAPVCITLAEP